MRDRVQLRTIYNIFNRTFKHWKIRLPPEDIRLRRRGKIEPEDWTIWYLFGSDGDGEYLDYYSYHRMTDDNHIRIHADGRVDCLPAISWMRPGSLDAKEDAQIEAQSAAEDRRITRLLREKGFLH